MASPHERVTRLGFEESQETSSVSAGLEIMLNDIHALFVRLTINNGGPWLPEGVNPAEHMLNVQYQVPYSGQLQFTYCDATSIPTVLENAIVFVHLSPKLCSVLAP
ncbi:hypothetical protein K504DRAFT_500448 [Pleomassaria siparia CBS 279.74]|uniref:Uncharacterized protein n=1 Tax=Pleomassaria siparia CBS 279.74 TaxID=1314801 RepID=A0A6G1KG37_9PLEO|nr:hypothetical protein K504DRAFT_500448 [Pleomassaria siparia CBS 279.74]